MQNPTLKQQKPKEVGRNQSFTVGEVAQPTAPKETEELTRVLSTLNPNAPHNVVRYAHGVKAFRQDPTSGQTHFHVAIDGNFQFIDEDNYQMNQQKQDAVLRNQFNFSTRGTQTFNLAAKSTKVETARLEVQDYSGQFSKSIIYDLYKKKNKGEKKVQQQANVQDPLKFNSNEGLTQKQEQNKDENKPSALLTLSAQQSIQIKSSLALAERLVTEKNCDEIITDFALWEDEADQYQPGKGSLFPLWDFVPDQSKPVSCLEWHPRYQDIFAVGYGQKSISTTINKKSQINIYSLKNIFHPEKILETESDVICLAWSPDNENLLLCGLLDGNVNLFDVSEQKLLASSSTTTGKHVELVSSVGWMSESNADLQVVQFISGSFDGQLIQWSYQLGQLKQLVKIPVYDTGLNNDIGPVVEEKKTLTNFQKQFDAVKDRTKGQLDQDATILIDYRPVQMKEQNQNPLVGISSLKFNMDPDFNWMFAFGADNGLVRLTSTAYTNDFHQSYTQANQGHSSLVHSITWNVFKPDILATASEDNYLKIFQIKKQQPLYTYDLQAPVTSVTFSNTVSTVLVAGTAFNNIHIFDFEQNKEKELCVQKVVPDQARLTAVSMNQFYPIITVGDSAGVVRVFKLSPNLRKRAVYVNDDKSKKVQVQVPIEEQKKQIMDKELAKITGYVDWCKKAKEANGE
ncbi:Dynein_intermediate chain [Hexamita inflata]|uniref:Dynein_intermediate chain n=1 Tax=Hexamita inflata TaxID=28002 RepID=A0ABP1I5Z5_9EUKA